MCDSGVSEPQGGHCLFRGLFSALEALIRPHVSPIAVPSTIGYAEIIEIAVDRLKGSSTIKIGLAWMPMQKKSLTKYPIRIKMSRVILC